MANFWLPGDSDFAKVARGWPNSRNVKPSTPLVLNTENRITRNLEFSTLYPNQALNHPGSFITGANLAKGYFPFENYDVNGKLAPIATPFGVGAYKSGSGQGEVRIVGNTGFPVGATNLSVVVVYYLGGVSSGALSNFRISSHLDTQIVSWTSSTVKLRHAFSGQWNIDGDTTINVDTATQLVVAGWTFNDGVGRLYGNGNFLHTKTGNSSIGGSGTDFYLLDTAFNPATILMSSLWSRTLSDAEMWEIASDIYQLYRPVDNTPYLISVPAAGGTPSLSSPGVINVLSDRATPQVTLTF